MWRSPTPLVLAVCVGAALLATTAGANAPDTRPVQAAGAAPTDAALVEGRDADGVRKKFLRIALYNDTGASTESADMYHQAVQGFITNGTLDATIRVMSKDEVAGVSHSNTDVVMFPGGSGDGQFDAIGEGGRAAVTKFVETGGGYIGTCGGGFLADPGRCCSEKLPDSYCGGEMGCFASNMSLAIVAASAQEPWDRGHGNVTIRLTAAAVRELRLPSAWAHEDVEIVYWQGPIMHPYKDPEHPGLPPYVSRAKFTSEVNTVHPKWTTGQMLNADAIVTTSYGEGRVLVSSPHPEHPPQVLPLILAYVRWAGRLI